MKENKIPHKKGGGRNFFLVNVLEKWMDEGKSWKTPISAKRRKSRSNSCV